MKINYQGEPVDTTAKTVAEFLSARGVDPAKAIVEYGGEVYAPGADLSALALVDGLLVLVFQLEELLLGLEDAFFLDDFGFLLGLFKVGVGLLGHGLPQ